MGDLAETTSVNLEGSRNVFGAAVDAGAKRLVYASSVAAYGFHGDNPELLTEDVPPAGTDRHYYSAQKAELEGALSDLLAVAAPTPTCSGPASSPAPTRSTCSRTSPTSSSRTGCRRGAARAGVHARAQARAPGPRRAVPARPPRRCGHGDAGGDPRPRHSRASTTSPAPGTITMSDLADALGWYSVPLPDLAVDAAAELVARLPFVPAEAQWIESLPPSGPDGHDRARRDLRWRPRHDARDARGDGRGRPLGQPIR